MFFDVDVVSLLSLLLEGCGEAVGEFCEARFDGGVSGVRCPVWAFLWSLGL